MNFPDVYQFAKGDKGLMKILGTDADEIAVDVDYLTFTPRNEVYVQKVIANGKNIKPMLSDNTIAYFTNRIEEYLRNE